MNANVRKGVLSVNFKQAQEHNAKITEKIKALQSEYVSRARVRVVERMPDGRRSVVVDNTEGYIKLGNTKTLFNDYRALYPDDKKFFILIEPVEDIKRTVNIRLPVRTDAERQPASHIADPTPEQLKEE